MLPISSSSIFVNKKFVQHGPITTVIDCNVLSLFIFEENLPNYASGPKSALNTKAAIWMKLFSNKKRNLRKYSIVFFLRHFPKNKVFGGPYIILICNVISHIIYSQFPEARHLAVVYIYLLFSRYFDCPTVHSPIRVLYSWYHYETNFGCGQFMFACNVMTRRNCFSFYNLPCTVTTLPALLTSILSIYHTDPLLWPFLSLIRRFFFIFFFYFFIYYIYHHYN